MMPSRFSNFAKLNLKNGLLEKLDTLSQGLVSFVGAGHPLMDTGAAVV